MTEMAITIDRAVPADAAAVCDVRDRAWLEAYPHPALGVSVEDVRLLAQGPDGEYVPRRIAYLQEQYATQTDTQATFVARLAGKVVGCVNPAIHQEDGRRYINAMYVAPEMQGKGIGRLLLQRALDWHGPDQDIYLEVVSYNHNAIDFYRHFGFEITDSPVLEDEDRPAYLKTLPQLEMRRPATSLRDDSGRVAR